jgi:hypothetical protein
VPLSTLLPALPYAAGVLAALEVAYVLLRRAAQRFRPRLLYHLWALSVAALAGWSSRPTRTPRRRRGKTLTAVSIVLSSIIGFALVEALCSCGPGTRAAARSSRSSRATSAGRMLVTARTLAGLHFVVRARI